MIEESIQQDHINYLIVSIYRYCCCSAAQSCLPLCEHMDCSMPGLSVPHHLPEFAQVHVRCIGDAIQPSYPLMPSCPLPSIFPSIRDFFSESSVHIRWPKYWSFSFSLNPSSEYSGFISLKIDWFDLLAVQGIFRSLFRHHSLVQFSRSVMPDSLWPQASLSMINFQSLLKLMSIESVMPSSHLILWHLLLLLPSVFPSTRDFSSELAAHIRCPEYWSFSFGISPSSLLMVKQPVNSGAQIQTKLLSPRP